MIQPSLLFRHISASISIIIHFHEVSLGGSVVLHGQMYCFYMTSFNSDDYPNFLDVLKFMSDFISITIDKIVNSSDFLNLSRKEYLINFFFIRLWLVY